MCINLDDGKHKLCILLSLGDTMDGKKTYLSVIRRMTTEGKRKRARNRIYTRLSSHVTSRCQLCPGSRHTGITVGANTPPQGQGENIYIK